MWGLLRLVPTIFTITDALVFVMLDNYLDPTWLDLRGLIGLKVSLGRIKRENSYMQHECHMNDVS